MIEKINKESNLRFERKITIHASDRWEILHRVNTHRAFFREIYAPRQVNNVYLDTLELKFYHDNKIGISERKKVRIRWYGATFGAISRPRLEYKLKYGLLGDKWVFDLPEIYIAQGFSVIYLHDMLKNADLPNPILEDLTNLRPTLLNSYQRTYFQTADKKFRLTLDEQLCYYRIDHFNNQFLGKHLDDKDYILELKYAPEEDSLANEIAGSLAYRLDKSSKYVNGIDRMKTRGGW